MPPTLTGNDDYGTISAWLFWSYLGLYPWTGTAYYLLGSPFFETATLALPDGITLTITAHNYGPENIYVSKAAVNGVRRGETRLMETVARHRLSAILFFGRRDTPAPLPPSPSFCPPTRWHSTVRLWTTTYCCRGPTPASSSGCRETRRRGDPRAAHRPTLAWSSAPLPRCSRRHHGKIKQIWSPRNA